MSFAFRTSARDVLKCLRCALYHRPMIRRSLAAAVVVGSVLVMLNQGVVFSREELETLAWKVPLTYVVPFLVSTWGVLSNARRQSGTG